MTQLERQQSVYEILKDLRSLEPLKKLFWSELNYQRVNQSLSRRGWTDTASNALSEDPVLFATGGANNDFDVIYACLSSDRLLLGLERPVVSRLLRDHPYALFIFSNATQDRWHFLNVRYDDKLDKRQLFRRITIGPEERLLTASERLAILDLEDTTPEPSRLSPLAIQQRHEEAFDVEAVTKKFFEQYARVFMRVEQLIQGFSEPERKRLFTQRLFNRLMFIAFIQKKGWLKFNLQTDYLLALWKNYIQGNSPEKNFYRDRLKHLFFAGLNTPNEIDIIGINRGGFLKRLIGDVPYLNGGLFEEDEDDRNPGVVVTDECIQAILNELFDRFNFTVTESTPLDIEVAVDPEMLGKVFEELVTGRHETGSYYTPKPVVSFMCREALKGYLKTILPGESSAAIQQFIEEHNPSEIRNPEAVLETLRRVKVCDPACGSGAYLLGMLHELLDLRACLFATKNLDPISTYERKLEIIQNNVYGVDLDPFAVNIARLRLWLSLAVDFEGNNPPPLPNLDFKIEVGDSLTAPNPEAIGQQAFRDELIRQYREAKAQYMTAHGGKKMTLRQQIVTLKNQVSVWTHAEKLVVGFDWPVEFAEVFAEGGFDIVLANPPYVRADAQFKHIEDETDRQAAIAMWKNHRKLLLQSGIYQTLWEKWDLYLPFLERAYQLLRPNGNMVFIISDAYNAAKYAQKSHEFFVKNSRVERIDFCTDIPLFEAGVSNTIVHFAKVMPDANHRPVRVRRWGESRDDFDRNAEVLSTAPQTEFDVAIFRIGGTSTTRTTESTVTLGQVLYISTGLRPWLASRLKGMKKNFVTDDLVKDSPDSKHPKMWVESKDIVRWQIRRVRYLEWGTSRAPAQFESQTFPDLYEAPEKLLTKDISSVGIEIVYDPNGCLPSHTAYCCVPWHYLKGVINSSISKTAKYQWQSSDGDREEREEISQQFYLKYILAVMNSTFAKNWLAMRRQSKIHIYPDDWKPLPIAHATASEQAAIVELVDEILILYAQHGYPLPADAAERLGELEREVDRRVARLYGVTIS